MLSLRKALEDREAVDSVLASYRATLLAVGEAGADVCPTAGEPFQAAVSELAPRLSGGTSGGSVKETEEAFALALQQWRQDAAQSYRDNTQDVKRLIVLLAAAARRVGERDQRHTKEFQKVTTRLQETARLNDLGAMRQSLGSSVAAMNKLVSTITHESKSAVAELRSQLATYEARLEEVERMASTDQLTGLANRRRLEWQIDLRIGQGQPFSLLYIDLNGFKQINDSLGHAAGDEVLRQFASELRSAFRATDVVCRWGGDEFVVMVDGGEREGELGITRIQRLVLGKYMIHAETQVEISAAVGYATWQEGDSLGTILERADASMYQQKIQATPIRL